MTRVASELGLYQKKHDEIAWKLSQVEYEGRRRVKDIKTGVVQEP